MILPKISRYVKAFQIEDADKDKNNNLMSFCINDEKQLEKYKTIWTKIEHLKSIDLNALPVFDDRSIKTEIRTYADKFYTNFRVLSVLEDDIEWESFTIISTDSLFVYENKYYQQIYLDNFAHKIVGKRMINYVRKNLFETDKDLILINRSYKCCITTKLT